MKVDQNRYASTQLIEQWLNVASDGAATAADKSAAQSVVDSWLLPLSAAPPSEANDVTVNLLRSAQAEAKRSETPRMLLRQKVRRQAARQRRQKKVQRAQSMDTKRLVDTTSELKALQEESAAVRRRFVEALSEAFQEDSETAPSTAAIQNVQQQADSSAGAATVVGTASGYWKSFSENWVVGTVLQVGVTLAVQGVGTAASSYLGVPAGAASPLINVASTLTATLSVSVLKHSSRIVTDPDTGLKSVAHDFVGACSGAVAGEAFANTAIGTFGGRIVGQIVGEKVNAIVIGRIEPTAGEKQTETVLKADEVIQTARRTYQVQQQQQRDTFLEQAQSDNAAELDSEEALQTRLFLWRKMRAPILTASAVAGIAAAFSFAPNTLVKPAAGAATYVLDYLTQLATSTEVQAETFRAAYTHPYLGPILKQSILRRLPLDKLEDATEYTVRKILQYAPVKQIDDQTRSLLQNRVRESIIRELMIEDLLVRVSKVAARQATLRAAEKGVEAVQSNWKNIDQALSDLRTGAEETASFVRQRLRNLAASSQTDSTEQIVGEAVLAGAAAMAQNESERNAMESAEVQQQFAQEEQADLERSLKNQAKLARRLRDERVSVRARQRAEESLQKAAAINARRQQERLQRLEARAKQRMAARQQESVQKAAEINRQREAARLLRQKVQQKVVRREQAAEQQRQQTNEAIRSEFKEQLLADRDVIMQQVWDENFSDSTLNFLKDFDGPSIARLAGEAYGAGAVARAARLGQTAQAAVRAAPAVVETARAGVDMLRTATSSARVMGAKNIAKSTAEGSRARFVRDLDEALTQLPTADAVTKEALVEKLKQTAGIHSTVVQGIDVDKATSWSARDAAIKMMGLEPGKTYNQQLGELAGDIGFGAPLRNAVQNVLGSFFKSDAV